MTGAAGTLPAPLFGTSSSTTHISLHLKRFSGGSKETPEAFLRQLKYAKAATGWTDVQALHYASLHLDGKDAEWFSTQDFVS